MFKAGFRKGHNVCIIHPLPGPPGSTQCLFRISTTFPDKITYCPMHRTLRHILPWAPLSTQLADKGPQEPGPPYLKQGLDTLQGIPVVPRQCPLPTACKSWPSGPWYHPWRLGMWAPQPENFSYQCMASNSLSGLHTTCRNCPTRQARAGSVPAQVSMPRIQDPTHRRLGASPWPTTGPSSLQTKRARGGPTQQPHPFPRDLGSHSGWGGPGGDQ